MTRAERLGGGACRKRRNGSEMYTSSILRIAQTVLLTSALAQAACSGGDPIAAPRSEDDTDSPEDSAAQDDDSQPTPSDAPPKGMSGTVGASNKPMDAGMKASTPSSDAGSRGSVTTMSDLDSS